MSASAHGRTNMHRSGVRAIAAVVILSASTLAAMMRPWVPACSAMLLFCACGRSSFEGFRPVHDDVHFKLRILGDGERIPTDSDSVLVRVRMARHGDAPGSLFSTEHWYGAIEPLLPEGCARAIRFHEGDSVSLVAGARRVPWATIGAERGALPDTAWVDLEVSLFALRSRAESRRMAQELLLARTAADEDSTLARFFAGQEGPWSRYMGVYYQLLQNHPKAPRIQSGQMVTIAYAARFLDDDRMFDDTHAHQPLTFRLGDPGQVIKGLEIAVHLLPDKGKGRFIIPSELAFGPGGSSSGIVPPWTPVLYEVEVTDAGDVAPSGVLMDGTDASR